MHATDVRSERERSGCARRPRHRVRVALAIAVTGVAVLLGTATVPAAAEPAARTPSAPDPRSIVWEADSAPDLLSAFDRTEYNEESGAPSVVSSPNLPGRKALQFTVPGGGTRSELVPKIDQQRNGQNLYFGYSGKLTDDFPVDADKYQIFMQWHQNSDDGSPPVSLQVKRNQFFLTGGGNDGHEGFEVPIGPAKAGQDVNLAVRILFSKKPEQGSVDVWSGGRKAVSGFKPPSGTAYDDKNYIKVGLYRDSSLTSEARLWVNNVVVGTDLASVQREVGGPPASAQDEESTTTTPSDDQASDPPSSDEDSSWSLASFAFGAAAVVAIGLVIALVRRNRERQRR